jgi:hypothetical protein
MCFSLKYRLREGAPSAPLPLSTANLVSFFLQTAAQSSYVGEINVVAKAIDSNRTPWIAL